MKPKKEDTVFPGATEQLTYLSDWSPGHPKVPLAWALVVSLRYCLGYLKKVEVGGWKQQLFPSRQTGWNMDLGWHYAGFPATLFGGFGGGVPT